MKKIILIIVTISILLLLSMIIREEHSIKKNYLIYKKEINKYVDNNHKKTKLQYDIVKYNGFNKVVEKEVNEFNDLQKLNEEKVLYINTKCRKELKELYYFNFFSYYEDNNYISISRTINLVPNCNEKSKDDYPKITIYSKKLNRVITQEEFRLFEGIDPLSEVNAVKETLANSYVDVFDAYKRTRENGIFHRYLYIADDGKIKMYFKDPDGDNYLETVI